MGRVASKLTRPVRTFNIENRARRALEKQQEQGIAAPKHESTKEQIAEIQRSNPQFLMEQQERNEALHEKLKGLYVEGEPTPQIKSTQRPLPESRRAKEETDFGSMDTFHTIPEGRANLKTIVNFISQHQLDPEQVTARSIAQDHALDEEEVNKILTHFKALNFHIPQEMYQQNPKLKKMVAEQINAASSAVAQFQLSLPKDSPKVNTDTGSEKT